VCVLVLRGLSRLARAVRVEEPEDPVPATVGFECTLEFIQADYQGSYPTTDRTDNLRHGLRSVRAHHGYPVQDVRRPRA